MGWDQHPSNEASAHGTGAAPMGQGKDSQDGVSTCRMEPGPMGWVQHPWDGARTPHKDPSQPWAGLPHAGRGVLTPLLPHTGPELVSGHLNECTGLVRVSEEEAVPDPAPPHPPRSPAPSTHHPDAEAAVAFATPCGDSGRGRRGDGPTP